MKKLKVGDIVIAPDTGGRWLTAGKEYKVIEVDKYNKGLFIIINDGLEQICCFLERCFHLNGGNWIVK